MRSMIVAAVLLAVLTGAGCGGKKKQSVFDTAGKCPTPPSTNSAGNAQISAQATGGRYSKLVVVHAKEKANGAPIKGGKITLHAEMSCPMSMRLINKNMQETSPGTYKAGYSLIMPGQWAFYFVLRDKNGDATTSAFPLTIKAPGS
ncbi:MAG: hypothetical protein E6G31_11375 [Actinobacteria bacterium]|jgi:hypothetical protein|nr:MAG: hypothetical protein E6G31_11375 [Actinomycetota bacterium]